MFLELSLKREIKPDYDAMTFYKFGFETTINYTSVLYNNYSNTSTTSSNIVFKNIFNVVTSSTAVLTNSELQSGTTYYFKINGKSLNSSNTINVHGIKLDVSTDPFQYFYTFVGDHQYHHYNFNSTAANKGKTLKVDD